MVRFSEAEGSKALEVSREDISVDTLYWKYDAVKVSGPASGSVEGKKIGEGLKHEVGPFSLGDWTFTLYGYRDSEYQNLMYKGTGTGTVEKDKVNEIRISVEPQMSQKGTGNLHVSKSIQLTKDGVVVKGSDGKATYIATGVALTRLSDGEEVAVDEDDESYWKAIGITSGSYKVVVSFVDAATGITHAENTAYVNVFDGLTTVVKGTLDEVTSSISFDADVKEGRISETKDVTPDTETGNVSASFGFSPVSNESSTGNDVLGTTIEGSFSGSGSIELNVYGSEGASRRFEVSDGKSVSAGFDINLSEGLTIVDGKEVSITTYIIPGLTGTIEVKYRAEDGSEPEDEQPEFVSYDVETGKLVFKTTHFSDYYVMSDSVAENTTTGKRYATLQDAVDYAKYGEEIKLLKNVDTVESLVFSNGTKLVMDLNGHTVKNVVELDSRWPDYFTVVSIDNESSVTLKNGTIQAMDNDCYAVNIIDGNLVIESGKYIGNVSVVQVQKGTLEIQGGEFSLIQTWPNSEKTEFSHRYTINCIDANYKDGSAVVAIKGGTFKMFNPQDCAAEGAHTNFVAEGYISVKEDDTYTVREKAANQAVVMNGIPYSSLDDAVRALNGAEKKDVSIVILDDKVVLGNFKEQITSNQGEYSITFVGNGKDKTTIDVKTDIMSGESNGANYIDGANLSFKDLTVCIGDSSDWQGFIRAGWLSFESCDIVGMGSYWGKGATFVKCTFVDQNASGAYNLKLWDGSIFKFEECVFDSSYGRFILAYKVGSSVEYSISVSDCVFNNKSGNDKTGKTALTIKDKGEGGCTIGKCVVDFSNNKFNSVLTGPNGYQEFQILTVGDAVVKDSKTKVTIDNKIVYNPNPKIFSF